MPPWLRKRSLIWTGVLAFAALPSAPSRAQSGAPKLADPPQTPSARTIYSLDSSTKPFSFQYGYHRNDNGIVTLVPGDPNPGTVTINYDDGSGYPMAANASLKLILTFKLDGKDQPSSAIVSKSHDPKKRAFTFELKGVAAEVIGWLSGLNGPQFDGTKPLVKLGNPILSVTPQCVDPTTGAAVEGVGTPVSGGPLSVTFDKLLPAGAAKSSGQAGAGGQQQVSVQPPSGQGGTTPSKQAVHAAPPAPKAEKGAGEKTTPNPGPTKPGGHNATGASPTSFIEGDEAPSDSGDQNSIQPMPVVPVVNPRPGPGF
jgi:hypothetical protein